MPAFVTAAVGRNHDRRVRHCPVRACKLNDADPRAWAADILARLPDYPAHRIAELMPWVWKARTDPATRATTARHIASLNPSARPPTETPGASRMRTFAMFCGHLDQCLLRAERRGPWRSSASALSLARNPGAMLRLWRLWRAATSPGVAPNARSCQYSRGAESRGAALDRERTLPPKSRSVFGGRNFGSYSLSARVGGRSLRPIKIRNISRGSGNGSGTA